MKRTILFAIAALFITGSLRFKAWVHSEETGRYNRKSWTLSD